MRWGSRVALIIMVACAVGVVQVLSPSVRAQDATPAARQRAGGSETVSARTLASGTMEVFAPGKGQFGLGRIVLAPGAGLAFNPMNPAAVLVYTAAGGLTFRVDVPMTVSRRGGLGTPVPTQPEAIAADTEFTLRDGDSALFPGTMAGEVRNAGTDEATAWVVDIVHLIEVAATPTP
jgi:hypothetical protein